jgi:hypothetical protein
MALDISNDVGGVMGQTTFPFGFAQGQDDSLRARVVSGEGRGGADEKQVPRRRLGMTPLGTPI